MAKQDPTVPAARAPTRIRTVRSAASPRPSPVTAPSPLSELWAELKLLGSRSGAKLVSIYVAAARSVLTEAERLEDLAAERRYKQHAAQTARGAARTKQLPPVEGA